MTPISKALILIGAASMVAAPAIASAAGANLSMARGASADGEESQLAALGALGALQIAGIVAGLAALGFTVNEISKSN